MPADTQGARPTKMQWAGRIVSGLVIAMLCFSAVMKLIQHEEVLKEMPRLGYEARMTVPIGILELVCTAIYAIPQTSVLGAILLTGYLGGATATHVRIADPFYGPVIGGVLVWLGLFLRDARIRELIPFRR